VEDDLRDATADLIGRGSQLRIGVLASAFRATSSSYKYYWFLALLDSLPHLDGPVLVTRIVRSMVVLAWFSVAQYRLSLGRTDRLQQCVLDLQSQAGLAGTEPRQRLEAALDAWPERERWGQELARFVPGRFVGAWFPEVARLRPYDRRGARDVARASDEAWGTPAEAPYRLFDRGGVQMIEVSPIWRRWLTDNLGLVRSHAQLHLCRYLQARNPGIPGIIDKMEPPGRRLLAAPRRWWRGLMDEGGVFATDVYTGEPLERDFDLDHFLPWSFVAHDEPWNLAPTSAAVNRSKGDRIPDIDVFLPRLARLHAEVIVTSQLPPAMARSYSDFLRMEIAGDGADMRNAIVFRYRERLGPLAQIATGQGFPGGWRPGN
jgi:hypothetical protein